MFEIWSGYDLILLLLTIFINHIFNQDLAKHIDDYTITYDPEDQLEWKLVLGEIRSFIEVCFKQFIKFKFNIYLFDAGR